VSSLAALRIDRHGGGAGYGSHCRNGTSRCDGPGAPEARLVEAAKLLGAEPVDTGPNLNLIADVGEVGTRKINFNGPVAMAPPVRVWLDMLGEQRGEDAAALFREAAIGY